MKVKEITIGKSGVIPIASYSNLRPSFSMTVEPEEGEELDSIFKSIQMIIDNQFEREEQNAAIKRIEKLYKNIRFYKKNGKKYPSVTSIMDWDTEWRIPSYELKQYGSRGTIVDRLLQLFLKESKWFNPKELIELKDDVNSLLSGNLKLHWEDCTHIKFMEKYGELLGEPKEIQKAVFNEGLGYAGTPDLIAPFKGLKSIIDCKTGVYDFAQLAAYAACEEGVKQLVVFPLGPTNNVSGYSKPVIRLNWGDDWKRFLLMRKKFRENFGI